MEHESDHDRAQTLDSARRLCDALSAFHPELLGDVFAWNKLFRREFWDNAGLTWPEGIRYEDQPTTTPDDSSGNPLGG